MLHVENFHTNFLSSIILLLFEQDRKYTLECIYTISRLYLILGKFEEKCKGKKIARKSIRKKKLRKKKIKFNKLFLYSTSNSFNLF